MVIELNVLNYSNRTSDRLIELSIMNLLRYLSNNGVNKDNVLVHYNNQRFYQMILKFIRNNNGNPLIDDGILLDVLNEDHLKGHRFVIIGEEIPTKYPWGDALIGFLTVIKNIKVEKNIWHEVAHVLGADDHYDEKKNPLDHCVDSRCIMQYGKTDGILCSAALDEIQSYLFNNCS